ncbi:hypothetical protein ACS0TY_017952 [Phlomoides rotata]
MHDLVGVSDEDCKDQLRMDQASFHKLSHLAQTIDGLKSSRNISVAEKVARMDPLGNAIGPDGDRGKATENGFKAGFQRELEKSMRKILPGTDIVANPHINSKIHANPHLKCVLFKSWSYYSQWLEIFGKDRATGENVVDPIDLVNDLLRMGFEQESETGDKYIPRSPDVRKSMTTIYVYRYNPE